MRLLKISLVLCFLLLALLFSLARIDPPAPEAARDDPVEAPAAPGGLGRLLERFKLPEISLDVLRLGEIVLEGAGLPRPVDLSPEDPDSLPRASAAFPDFGAIGDTEMRKKSFFQFMAPLIEAENVRIEEKRLQLLRLHVKQPG